MGGQSFRPAGGGTVVMMPVDDGRDESRLFGDEVVIDFPSPAPAIHRMRRAFLRDERAVAVAADLHLSRRHALEGVTVPLSVPVRRTCRVCGGRGEVWTDRCAACDGEGLSFSDHQVHVSVPAGTSDGARFHFSVSPQHDVTTRVELRVRVA